ncbi:MAG: hypothetical protein Ct9H300mP27_04180 [Chloroflexota bacterium]|nr:MAG: hypothetical protein Ct9H300mP27_04180 [Chloroflexota bacterium]
MRGPTCRWLEVDLVGTASQKGFMISPRGFSFVSIRVTVGRHKIGQNAQVLF